MITRLHRALRSESGFTLSEMTVSMAILGIFFAVFATVISSSMLHGNEVQEQAVLQTELRATIDSMAADLRQTTNAGDTSLARVSTATGTQLTFLSPDRLSTMHLRRISYQLTSGNLQRSLATSSSTAAPWSMPTLGPWTTVARSIVTTGTPLFTYYDINGATTTVLANIKTVRIRATVATISASSRQYTYETRVALRPQS